MGTIIKFPTTRTVTNNERHYLKNLQTAIKTVRREYYLDNKQYNLMIQRVTNFMRKQWVVYENEVLERLPPN